MKDSNNFDSILSRRNFLLGLASVAILPFGPEAKAFSGFDPFSFGYVTGSYLITGQPDSYKLLQESQLFLQDAIKGLNSENLDFVLFGGDNVEAPGADDVNWQLFLDIVQSLNCPWNFVLGEQDLAGPQMPDAMKTYGRDWKGKGIDSEVPYWSYDPMPGIHVVGLSTARRNNTAGALSTVQLDWLKKDLTKNRSKFTIVASHHPLLAPEPFDGGSPWDDYVVPQGASAREIMGQHPSVRLALSGHVHINKIQQEKQIWYVSSPSLAVYPCAYRIFRVTPDYVSVETYQISFPALIKKARQKVETWSLPYKFSPKIETYLQLMDGGKNNEFARLPMAVGKPMEPLTAKKRKEPARPGKNKKGENSKPEKTDKPVKEFKEDNSNKAEEKATPADDDQKNIFGFNKKSKHKSKPENKTETDKDDKSVNKVDTGSENSSSVNQPAIDVDSQPKPASEDNETKSESKPIPELLSAPWPASSSKQKNRKSE